MRMFDKATGDELPPRRVAEVVRASIHAGDGPMGCDCQNPPHGCSEDCPIHGWDDSPAPIVL